jgi:hypothetical protein
MGAAKRTVQVAMAFANQSLDFIKSRRRFAPNKNARQMLAARFLYKNAGFGSRAERKCAGSKPEGGVLGGVCC